MCSSALVAETVMNCRGIYDALVSAIRWYVDRHCRTSGGVEMRCIGVALLGFAMSTLLRVSNVEADDINEAALAGTSLQVHEALFP
jgi:hypothetical protein